MLENKRDENASRKEDNNSHKDNLSKISTDNTKPKKNLSLCPEKLKSVLSKAQLHLSAAKAKRNEDSIRKSQGSPEILDEPLNLAAKKMTNTTSNSAEKSGDADKTTALPVSPGVSDKDESEKNDETSSNTEEIRKVVGDPSVHTHKKEEKSAGIVVKQEPSSEPEDEKFEEQMSNFEEKNSDNVDGHSPSAPEEEAPPSKSDDITNGQPEEMEVNDPENSTKVDRMETEEGKADDEANKTEDSQDGRDHKCKDDEVEPDKTDASSPMETSDIDTENAEQGEGKMEAEKLDSPQETQDSAESEKQLSHMETEDTQPPDKKDAEDERGSVENGKEGIDSQKVCQDNLAAPPVSASGAKLKERQQ
ncbi:high mobility group nucleosome-binding domain-containing protein 5-like [Ptychodera flava]|uniref:high mobility group nucleosome-binding domain-containing protein 5-like n=1 Tax=Ptychodera flava TaxID=63121 RepID=UPI003969F92E